jgi:hypothetical protein
MAKDNATNRGKLSRRSVIGGGAAVGATVPFTFASAPNAGAATQPDAEPAVSRSAIIREENAKPGTTDWILTKVTRDPDEPYQQGWHVRTKIQGYASRQSVKHGETLTIHVSADPEDQYQLDIYRMGYYGGKGGRLVRRISPRVRGHQTAKPQPTPEDGPNHVIECQWEESISLEIPQDWVSGVYLGKLSTWMNSEAESYIIFVVRDDRPADLLFQVSDLTWVAYNRWPQWHSLYDSPTDPWGTEYDAGLARPYAIYWNGFPADFEPLTNGSGEFLMTEYQLAFWLEKEGYDVTYISNLDTHEDPPGLLRGSVFLSVGHDEYWTQQMYDNVVAARDAGVHLAFLSGNSVSGRVELLPGRDGQPNRAIHLIDRGFDEVELMGSTSRGVGMADWTCVAPKHWVFEGTGMEQGDSIPNLVGWEYHGHPVATGHKDLVVLAEGPVTTYNGEPTTRSYAATIYTAGKGNYVFNAATCWWCKPLSAPPANINPPHDDFSNGDERVRRITKNVLDRMIRTRTRG